VFLFDEGRKSVTRVPAHARDLRRRVVDVRYVEEHDPVRAAAVTVSLEPGDELGGTAVRPRWVEVALAEYIDHAAYAACVALGRVVEQTGNVVGLGA